MSRKSHDDEISDLQRRTEEVEAAKREKQREREHKRLLKEHAARQASRERMVAPVMLGLTVVLAAVLYVVYG
jgi:hypothetical protein